MARFIISESEKNNIRKMYGLILENTQFDCIKNNKKFVKTDDGYLVTHYGEPSEMKFKEDGTIYHPNWSKNFTLTWQCVNDSPTSYWTDKFGGVYYNDYSFGYNGTDTGGFGFEEVQTWPPFLKKIIDKYKPKGTEVYNSQLELFLFGVNVDGVSYDLMFDPQENKRWYKKASGDVFGSWLGTYDFDDNSQKIILTPTINRKQNIIHSGGTVTEQDIDCSAIFDKKKIIRKGSKGLLVQAMREAFDVKDGDYYDNELRQAVMTFQRGHQLPVTGNIGVKTLTTITKYYLPDFCKTPLDLKNIFSIV